jgi:signal transduction histidine kinase
MDPGRRKTISKIVFACAIFTAFGIAILYLYNIIAWGNLPDFGFSFRSARGLREVGIVMEQGRLAGMKAGDRILTVNGRTFSNIREFRSAMNREVGGKNTYLIERKDGQFEATIINTPLGIKRAFIRSGLIYLTGLCYWFIGTLAFLMKPHKRTSWIFFLFSVVVGLFVGFYFRVSELKPSWLGTVHILLNTLVPAVILHLILSFPEERNLLKKYPYAQFLPYLASGLLFFRIRSLTPDMLNIPRVWYIILIACMVLAVFFFIVSGLLSWYRSTSEIVRVRAKLVLLGFAISALPPLSDAIINSLFHMHIFPNFNYHLPFLIAFPLAVAYSMIKHNLFDIDSTIRRTFGYILATVGIAVIYTFFALVPPLLFGKVEFLGTAAFPILFALALLFVFNLARSRIQQFIDRIFYRLEYDYQETVQRISEAMRSVLSLDQIGKKMLEIASGVLFAEKSLVMALNPKEPYYECIADSAQMKLPTDDPLIQKLEVRRKEVTQYDIEEDPLFEKEKEMCKRTFDRLEATVIVPMIFEERLIGLMSLGNKKSGKFYQKQDINLLKTLANQAALAIENVRLYQARIEALESSRKELERLNRAKSIALDHLSHELKTPLSVIQGSIRLLKRKLDAQTGPGVSEKSFETLEKQLHRLLEIQRETNEIIQTYQDLEEEPVALFSLVEKAVEKAKQRASHRDIKIHLDGEKDTIVFAVPKILENTLDGLLMNAIENTPDEGLIRVKWEQKAQWIELKVQDFGIGITKENQRHLFDGLFHTQSTEHYASKRPYDFGAGGKGLDLLKMKVYGQRFGFDIAVATQRCIHLSTDRDLCPGRISLCPQSKETKDCLSSGGSTFCVTFPAGEKPKNSREILSKQI